LFQAFWEGDIARHEAKHHGVAMPTPQGKQVKKRPIPNLIPLQQTSPTPSDSEMSAANFLAGGHSIFGGPSIIAQSDDEQEALQQQEMSEYCGNESALKDFASMIGEGYPEDGEGNKTDSSSDKGSPLSKIKKEKGGSFFDSLTEKSVRSEAQDLKCDACGHESKCLSEAMCHQKSHKSEEAAQRSFLGTVGLSSTRCQHCR